MSAAGSHRFQSTHCFSNYAYAVGNKFVWIQPLKNITIINMINLQFYTVNLWIFPGTISFNYLNFVIFDTYVCMDE